MKVDYVAFHGRQARIEYLAKAFRRFLDGRLLDVGCDKAHLKTILPDIDYVGLDISKDADIQLNLEESKGLPFADNSFDCVICSDVLEHLENLHQIFGDMVRVSRKYLIISLPNNWTNARRPIERGKGSFGHYGLPVDPPQDRHKWFFSLSEAMNFVKGQEGKFPISITEICATEKPRPLLVRGLRRLLFPSQEHYLNRYASTLWTVYEKRSGVPRTAG